MVSLSLMVLRSANIDALLLFYQLLGIEFTQEQHGKGPIHYSSQIDNFAMEIYPGELGTAPDRKQSGATMLGFQVDDLDSVFRELSQRGVTAVSAPKETAWGRRAIVLDPDGRSVELSESD